MVQLRQQQRVSRTGSLIQIRNAFGEQFPDRPLPAKSTIWKNVVKYQQHGTSLNRNRGNSGRRHTGRSHANVEAVRQMDRRNFSARRNPLGLPPATFNRITRLDLHWHPYKMQIRHKLLPGDLPRRLQFCEWLVGRPEGFLRNLVIGDEAAFAMSQHTKCASICSSGPAIKFYFRSKC